MAKSEVGLCVNSLLTQTRDWSDEGRVYPGYY